MPFAAFFLVLAGALAIAVLYPHLRVLAIMVFVVFAAVFGFLLFDQTTEGDRLRARIPVELVAISDLELTEGARYTRISGRVANGHDVYQLRDFDIESTLYDCPAADTPRADCAVIAQDTAIARVDVPPGQTRTFEAALSFTSRPPPKGVEVWEHRVTGTRGTNIRGS